MARNKVIGFAVDQLTDLNDEGIAIVQELAKCICDNSILEKNSDNSFTEQLSSQNARNV